MLEERISKLKKELDTAIEKKADYSIIYKISTDLDKLIVEYYNEKVLNPR